MDSNTISSAKIKKDLSSDSPDVILNAINEIRNQGNNELLLSLFDLLASNPSTIISKAILSCLVDIKDKNALDIFIFGIKQSKYSHIKRELLNALWQTNFELHPHISVFVDFLIQDSYEIGIEVLTILDICTDVLSDSEKNEYRHKIFASIQQSQEPKKRLLEEAISILESNSIDL